MFCFIIKILAEREYDNTGKVQSVFLLKHISNCRSCANWFAVLSGLNTKMSKADSCSIPAITDRIKNNVFSQLEADSGKNVTYSARTGYYPKAGIFATAAALMFAISLFMYNTRESAIDSEQVETEAIAEMVSVVVPESMVVSLPYVGDYLESYYESELEHIRLQISDTIQFFGNCLPLELAEL